MRELLATEHLVTLLLITALVMGLTVAARRRPGAWTVPVCRGLAVLLLLDEGSWWIWLASQGSWSLSYALPFQLCDLAAFVAAAALWTRRPWLVELTYFWGIAGTLNGIVTPDIAAHFPDYLYLQYFVAHGVIVGAALFLVVGLKIQPRPGAALRAFGWTALLLLVDAGVDSVTGANYLYLRHAPGSRSLLDLMGPWPWYVLSASLVTLLAFLLLELPFRRPARARRPTRRSPSRYRAARPGRGRRPGAR